MPFYILFLVPSMRLELTRLSALPPQDSVSTNSTTTAAHAKLYRALTLLTSEFAQLLNLMYQSVQAQRIVQAHSLGLPLSPGPAQGLQRATALPPARSAHCQPLVPALPFLWPAQSRVMRV